MKRILLVSTGNAFPNGAFAFLKSLQDYEPVSVTGLFFGPIDYEALAAASQVPIPGPYLQLKEKSKKILDDQKALFSGRCGLHCIKHEVHPNSEEWSKDILARESRFADLILLSGELFYADLYESQPNPFLQEALHVSECPVLILPEEYELPDRIVIAYDGSRKSLHAIKQFCYLLPQLTDLPTEIVYVDETQGESIPELESFKKFSKLHFSSVNFSKLNFKAAEYFATWIAEKKHPLLVSGSFGRSAFSYIAKRSFPAKVIGDHKMPVFIAHT